MHQYRVRIRNFTHISTASAVTAEAALGDLAELDQPGKQFLTEDAGVSRGRSVSPTVCFPADGLVGLHLAAIPKSQPRPERRSTHRDHLHRPAEVSPSLRVRDDQNHNREDHVLPETHRPKRRCET